MVKRIPSLSICSFLAVLMLASAVRADPKGDPATIAARNKFFGAEHVDQATGQVSRDLVIISWFTNSSYAVSVKGRVVLLDSFVTRLEVMPGRTPFVIQDLVDLHPEAIFLGHGHFDHADNAEFISGKLGNIPIYASPETCDNMQLDAVKLFGAAARANCVGVTSRGSIPGSEVATIDQLEPVATIRAFKHLHSTNTAPQDTSFPPVVINSPVAGACAPPCNIADSRDAAMFPRGIPLSSVLDISTSRAGQGGPIALFFSFRLRGDNQFTFVWHNSSGALREGCALPNNLQAVTPPTPSQPGQDVRGCFGPAVGAQVASRMEELGPTDVHIGSVVSLGFGINGERDIVDYITHVKPKVFIPAHVTAVALESSSLEWKVGYEKQLEAMSIPEEQRPELLWTVDPNDYLRPMVFNPKDARWAKAPPRDRH